MPTRPRTVRNARAPGIHLTARAVLERRPALELDAFRGLGRLRGEQVLVGRLGTAARVRQRLGQANAQPTAVVAGEGSQLDRLPIEFGGPVEGQGAGGQVGRFGIISARLDDALGALEVDRERLRIGGTGGLQRDGQPAVMVGPAPGSSRAMTTSRMRSW